MMTLRTSAALALLLLTSALRAQLVFIPDVDLRMWLNEELPGVVDPDGYLDTADPALVNMSSADLEVNWGPSDLTGVQYLTGLDVLELHYGAGAEGQAQVIPAWPPNLQYLDITGYAYADLPPFPAVLGELGISSCPMVGQLPPLPPGLVTLSIDHMPMLSALPAFPSTLAHLNCAYELSQLVALPELPAGMASMSLHGLSSLSALPPLPNGFVSLEMSAVPMLTELPPLPQSLQALRLGAGANVPLVVLPGELIELQLVDVPISGLPDLPPTLDILYLSGLSGLQSVPPLPPGLSEISLFGLPLLACLPQLPDTIMLHIASTGLSCLPNHPIVPNMMGGGGYVSYVDYWGASGLPLCTVLNSICPNNNGAITGHVYHDLDGNGIQDNGEAGWALATVLIEPDGVLLGVDSTGYFDIGMPDGDYSVSVQTNSVYATGISPAQHTADLVNAEADSLNDFGIEVMPGVTDLELDLTMSMAFVPGATRFAVLTCRNTGTTTVVANASLSLGDGAVITTMDPVPTSSSDSAADWALGTMLPGALKVVHANILTDVTAQLGMPIQVTAALSPTGDDVTPANNTVTLVDTVLASYDPNDKRVQPSVLTTDQVAQGHDLEYTVRFQNTGTYHAARVVITDTLSEALRWNTLRFISSSHACEWLLTGEGVLRFTFDPILLPDSNSNEPESHGFVKFAIKPSADLLPGEAVGNTANIYFDFNPPIHTPEASVVVVDETGIFTAPAPGVLSVYPVPARNGLTAVLPEGFRPQAVVAIGVDGRRIPLTRTAAQRMNPEWNVEHLAPGTYVLQVTDAAGQRLAARFTKE